MGSECSKNNYCLLFATQSNLLTLMKAAIRYTKNLKTLTLSSRQLILEFLHFMIKLPYPVDFILTQKK